MFDDQHCSTKAVTPPHGEGDPKAQLRTQGRGDCGRTPGPGGHRVQVPASRGFQEELTCPKWSPGAERNLDPARRSRVLRGLWRLNGQFRDSHVAVSGSPDWGRWPESSRARIRCLRKIKFSRKKDTSLRQNKKLFLPSSSISPAKEATLSSQCKLQDNAV